MKKLLLLLTLIPALLIAQIPDSKSNTFLNDFANLLTADQIHSLNERILSIEKKSSVQIAIIMLKELPEDKSIEDYTLEVGRQWHVGKADNGLVYVADIKHHLQRLEVANNLQGDISDLTAREIIDRLKNFYRANDYYGGLNELLDGIEHRVDPISKEQLKLDAIQNEKKQERIKQGFITFFLWLLTFGILGAIVWFGFLKKGYDRRQAEREAKQIEQGKESIRRSNELHRKYMESGRYGHRPSYDHIPTPTFISPARNYDNDAPARSVGYSSDNNSNSSSGSDYGSYGGGSSDSGFSGGGSSGSW